MPIDIFGKGFVFINHYTEGYQKFLNEFLCNIKCLIFKTQPKKLYLNFILSLSKPTFCIIKLVFNWATFRRNHRLNSCWHTID
jgi:hypothetical protein